MPKTASQFLTRAPNPSPSPAAPFAPGTLLLGRYKVQRKLGEGAMGQVYACEHVRIGRRVAVKVLKPMAGGGEAARRFRAEARATTAAGHPNIVDVLDAGELEDGRPYIAMEFLDGRTVLDAVRSRGQLDPQRAIRIGQAVARALHAAHEVGIVHRDLKAENVMLIDRDDTDELVKVVDFGIAHGVMEQQGRTTREGIAMGTPEYMAPEQAAGEKANPSFDIYALGVLLYEMLCGTPPFFGEAPLAIITKKCVEDSPPLAGRVDGLPESLTELVAQCLQREATSRPQTAAAVADTLRAIDAELSGLADAHTKATGAAPISASQALERAPSLADVSALTVQMDSVPIPGAQALARAASRREDLPPAQEMSLALGANDVPLAEAAERRERRSGGVWLAIAAIIFALAVVVVVWPDSPAASPSREVASIATPRPEPKPRPQAAEVPVPVPEQEAPPVPELVPDRKPAVRSSRDARVRPATLPSVSGIDAEPAPARESKAPAVDCDDVQPHARAARAKGLWAILLTEVDKRGCWTSQAERKKLRVQALSELKRWDACVRAGQGISDPEVLAWVRRCSKRAAGR